MNIRQEFEAWAIDHGYDVDESKIFGRLYHCDESIRALQVWQAATSRQEAKIKALVEALHMYQKAGVGSSTDYPAQWTAYTTSLLAIEAAKETP